MRRHQSRTLLCRGRHWSASARTLSKRSHAMRFPVEVKSAVLVSGLSLGAFVLLGLAMAQEKRPQPAAPRTPAAQAQPGAPRSPTAQAQSGAHHENIDRPLAMEIALDNDNEIMLAKFAETRAEN